MSNKVEATFSGVSIHYPIIISDGGPWAQHDMACAVCQDNKAILNLTLYVFEPCGKCRERGWELRKRKKHWWS